MPITKTARLVAVFLAVLVYCLSAPLGGAAAVAADPAAAGETQVCLDCHQDNAAQLLAGPHRVTTADGAAANGHVSCTSCHNGSPAHWEDDPEANPMTLPAALRADETAELCAQCHINPHQDNALTVSPHTAANVGCLGCHQVHGAPVAKQLKQAQPELCFSCHGDQRSDFAKPYHHAVGQGLVNCSACHLASDDNQAPLANQGRNATCFQCHAELQGPFPFEHQATLDWSTEEGGCVTCHDPHGSYLPRMLNQPYDGPHFQLCSQCHVVPKHNFNSQHGTAWAGVSCSECHADIHGSYTNRLFLSPTLEAQGCFVAGCHTQ